MKKKQCLLFIIIFLLSFVLIVSGLVLINNDETNKNTDNKESQSQPIEEIKEEKKSDELTIEDAKKIIKKYYDENLKDKNFEISNVKIVAHGDNKTYLVNFIQSDNDYKLDMQTIFKYANNDWIPFLPAWVLDEEDNFLIEKYNFILY